MCGFINNVWFSLDLPNLLVWFIHSNS